MDKLEKVGNQLAKSFGQKVLENIPLIDTETLHKISSEIGAECLRRGVTDAYWFGKEVFTELKDKLGLTEEEALEEVRKTPYISLSEDELSRIVRESRENSL